MISNANRTMAEKAVISASCSMTRNEMNRVAGFIGKHVGIQLPMSKQSLVEGRLRKRLEKLGISSFSDYLDYALETPEGVQEQAELVDVITTNKTNFFREPEHFKFLVEKAVPQLVKTRAPGNNKLMVWSAGCSTGEEPYTLAMVLKEAEAARRDFGFEILATDISHSCLRTASQGIYDEAKIEPVNEDLRKKYLLRSRQPDVSLVQMGPEIRSKIRFDQCNLMDRSFSIKQVMDVIFCRNVMIYFNNEIKQSLVEKFERQLCPGGYLFVGHSESLSGLKSGMEQVAPMVYRKPTD